MPPVVILGLIVGLIAAAASGSSSRQRIVLRRAVAGGSPPTPPAAPSAPAFAPAPSTGPAPGDLSMWSTTASRNASPGTAAATPARGDTVTASAHVAPVVNLDQSTPEGAAYALGDYYNAGGRDHTLIARWQRTLGVHADGVVGPDTTRAAAAHGITLESSTHLTATPSAAALRQQGRVAGPDILGGDVEDRMPPGIGGPDIIGSVDGRVPHRSSQPTREQIAIAGVRISDMIHRARRPRGRTAPRSALAIALATSAAGAHAAHGAAHAASHAHVSGVISSPLWDTRRAT